MADKIAEIVAELEFVADIEGEKDWIYGVKYNGKELFSGEKIPREAVLTLLVGDDELETDSLRTDSLFLNTSKDGKPIVDESWF